MRRQSDRLRVGPPPIADPARQHTRRFVGTPASVPAARRHVRELLRSWGEAQLEEAGAMLVTELMTNSVLHAGSDVVVELLADRDGVVVLVVGDASTTVPVMRWHGREASTGRGMWLLDHFSSERGVEVRGNGKRVWAVLCPELHGPDEGSQAWLATRLDGVQPD